MITKYEFWCRLRELERKYDKQAKSPVRRRLARIDEWASSIMDGWAATDGVPRWLCNELIHVEDGREVRHGVVGTPQELPPVYADMMFHGVLSDRAFGGPVLPSTFVFGKDSAKDGRARNARNWYNLICGEATDQRRAEESHLGNDEGTLRAARNA